MFQKSSSCIVMKCYFLQLIYELHQVVGERSGKSLRKNWITICMKLTGRSFGFFSKLGGPLLNTLKWDIFYKPPPHDVVEVTPISYALATIIHC